MEEGKSAFKILIDKATGKGPLGRPIDGNTVLEWILEIGINTRNWVDLAQYRDYWRALVNSAMNFWVP